MTPYQRLPLLLLAVGVILLWRPTAAKADTSAIVIDPRTNFTILDHFHGQADTGYRFKLRIKDANGAYSGDTLNSDTWQKQTDPWSDFSVATTDDSGDVFLALTGRPDIGVTPTDARIQIVYRQDGSSTTMVAEEQLIHWLDPTQTARIVLNPDCPIHTGFVILASADPADNGTNFTLPYSSDWPPMLMEPFSIFTDTVVDSTGNTVCHDGPYSAVMGGVVQIGPAVAIPDWQPTITGPLVIDRNNGATQFHLANVDSYTGPVVWRHNGTIINDNDAIDATLDFTPEELGYNRISVELLGGEASSELNFLVVDRATIQIDRLLPNPSGDDWSGETAILRNASGQTANLAYWSLERDSQPLMALSGLLSPGATLAVPLRRQLPNSGATISLVKSGVGPLDSATYSNAPESSWLIRTADGWQWDPPPTVAQAATAKTSQSESTHPRYSGTIHVTKPSGKMIDGTDESGEAVHIVIHASFTGEKPKLHTGDIIHITGAWYRSKNGPYISVRVGDEIKLMRAATKITTKTTLPPTTSKATAQPSLPPLVQTAEAAGTGSQNNRPLRTSAKPPINQAVAWLFIGLAAFGAGILADEWYLRYNKRR